MCSLALQTRQGLLHKKQMLRRVRLFHLSCIQDAPSSRNVDILFGLRYGKVNNRVTDSHDTTLITSTLCLLSYGTRPPICSMMRSTMRSSPILMGSCMLPAEVPPHSVFQKCTCTNYSTHLVDRFTLNTQLLWHTPVKSTDVSNNGDRVICNIRVNYTKLCLINWNMRLLPGRLVSFLFRTLSRNRSAYELPLTLLRSSTSGGTHKKLQKLALL